MRNRFTLAVLGLAVSSSALGYKLEVNGADYGTFVGRARVMAILAAENNGWDPSTGGSYSLMGKYISPSFGGFKLTAAGWLNGDLLGITDFDVDPTKDRTARGMFVAEDGIHKGQLTDINLSYKDKRLNAFAGRAPLDTPLTRNTYNHIPNSYTAFRVGATPIEGLGLSLGHVSEMSFGSRAMTDWGFIGEGTGTAGAAQAPNQPSLGQVTFHTIDEVALGTGVRDSSGITLASLTYSGLPHTELRLWDAYVHDIANDLYFDAEAKIPLNKLRLNLGLQYLRQDDAGDGTLGIKGPPAIQQNFAAGDLDYSLLGLKAGLIGPKKKWMVHLLYNHSDGDTAFFNPYGADPAYTSSIFSRNAYREGVDAWGVRGKYKLMKGLVFVAAYIDYGKSDTIGIVPNFSRAAVPTSNATELDLVLVWKPKQVKGLTVKTFYVNRTSEYDGFRRADGKKADATMSHWRLILTYKF